MPAAKIPEPPHLVTDLKTLCLTSLAREWERFARTARSKRQTHADFLAEIAAFEVTQRRERRIQRRLKEARFPVLKTLDGFDFAAPHGLDRDEILELFTCDFVEQAANVVLIGGVGTGKSHLAIALGMACVQKDYRVRFTTAAELCNLLVEAQAAGRLSRKLAQMARYDVVVLDELGYVPFDRRDADLLFNFITKVYERRSLVVTTNLPFAKWSRVFGDATAAAAVIDRIVHHATVLQTKGASYRLKDAKAKPRRRRRKEVAKR
jgi:DNA replication protein DnaC